MKMGRGVCAHLRSFFLFLYQSGAVPVATKGATLLEIVYTSTGMHYAYISHTPPFFSPPLIPCYFFSFPSFFSKTRLETFARETLKPTATDAMFRGPPINKKTFSRVHFSTLPRVTSKKFRPVKKETGMRSYLDTGLVNIRHVAKGKGTLRACTHVRRDC